ncbi:MAG: hypothetical protein HUU55_18200 [Myxococcales bacterium]|nr:hypothetical protein [Myxococcales bacterium]
MNRQTIGLFLLLTVLSGCLEELPDPSRIDSLRILAMVAEPPEAAPGDLVNLSALVVDPDHRPLQFHWYACLVPERGTGFFGGSQQGLTSGGKGYSIDDPGDCEQAVAQNSPLSWSLGDSETAEITIPLDFLSDTNVKRAYGIPEDATLDPLASAGLLTIAGVNLTVVLKVIADDESLVGFKRINVSLSDQKNTNPVDIAFDIREAGSELSQIPKYGAAVVAGDCRIAIAPIDSGKWRITAVNVPDPQASYAVVVGGTTADELITLQTRDEVYFYSFFSPLGKFAQDVVKSSGSGASEWSFKVTEPTKTDLWVVVRDGRGGTAHCHSSLDLVPLIR